MTDTPASAPITSDDDLVALARSTVGDAVRRQTWLLLFDDEDRPLPVLIPVDGMPLFPDADDVAVFAERLGMLAEGTGAASLALVWERPGADRLRQQDAAWVRGIHDSDAPVRAQLLSSDAGVRILDAELDALVA